MLIVGAAERTYRYSTFLLILGDEQSPHEFVFVREWDPFPESMKYRLETDIRPTSMIRKNGQPLDADTVYWRANTGWQPDWSCLLPLLTKRDLAVAELGWADRRLTSTQDVSLIFWARVSPAAIEGLERRLRSPNLEHAINAAIDLIELGKLHGHDEIVVPRLTEYIRIQSKRKVLYPDQSSEVADVLLALKPDQRIVDLFWDLAHNEQSELGLKSLARIVKREIEAAPTGESTTFQRISNPEVRTRIAILVGPQVDDPHRLTQLINDIRNERFSYEKYLQELMKQPAVFEEVVRRAVTEPFLSSSDLIEKTLRTHPQFSRYLIPLLEVKSRHAGLRYVVRRALMRKDVAPELAKAVLTQWRQQDEWHEELAALATYNDQAFDEVLQLLDDDQEQTRRTIAWNIRRVSSPILEQRVADSLPDPTANRRERAELLANYRINDAVIDTLFELSDERKVADHIWASFRKRAHQHDGIRDRIFKLLAHPSPDISGRAMIDLVELGYSQQIAWDDLLRHLVADRSDVRSVVATALGERRDDVAVVRDLLVKLLKDRIPAVSDAAAYSLAQRGICDDEIIARLTECVQLQIDDDYLCALPALVSLGVKSPRMISQLKENRDAAALLKLGVPRNEVVDVVIAALIKGKFDSDQQKACRKILPDALLKLSQDTSTLPQVYTLAQELKVTDESIIKLAISHARKGYRPAEDFLRQCDESLWKHEFSFITDDELFRDLTDTKSRVRLWALLVLVARKELSPTTTHALKDMSQDARPWVREAARITLARRKAVERLGISDVSLRVLQVK